MHTTPLVQQESFDIPSPGPRLLEMGSQHLTLRQETWPSLLIGEKAVS